MSRICHWFCRVFLLLAIFSAVGPLAILQMVAWTGMVWNYSKDQSVVQAVADTFSGERPCELCMSIQEMREEAPQDSVSITWGTSGWLLPLDGQTTLLIPPTEATVMLPEIAYDLGGSWGEVLLPPPIQELS
jgi:hypothetical protein